MLDFGAQADDALISGQRTVCGLGGDQGGDWRGLPQCWCSSLHPPQTILKQKEVLTVRRKVRKLGAPLGSEIVFSPLFGLKYLYLILVVDGIFSFKCCYLVK